jgi:serine/threonine-protein kinase
MIYEMLTGSVPFSGDNMLAVMNQHLNASPRPPREVNGRIPRSVEGIILKAIRKNPDERYQTAASLGHDLKFYEEIDPASFVFGPEQTARVPMSDRTIWLMTAGIGVAFIGGSALIVAIVFALKHL